MRAADDDDAQIVVPTADRDGAYSGPYAAGEVWVVAAGAGELAWSAASRRRSPGAGAHLIVEHERHIRARELDSSRSTGSRSCDLLRARARP